MNKKVTIYLKLGYQYDIKRTSWRDGYIFVWKEIALDKTGTFNLEKL